MADAEELEWLIFISIADVRGFFPWIFLSVLQARSHDDVKNRRTGDSDGNLSRYRKIFQPDNAGVLTGTVFWLGEEANAVRILLNIWERCLPRWRTTE